MTSKSWATEISSQRDLEKEFAAINKAFVGKETELNWEQRDTLIKNLRSVLNSAKAIEYKDCIVQGIHDTMASLVKSIHSLRTSVASEALSLVTDISRVVGDVLDQYTMETILSNLLKCGSVTKKLIVTKAAETTTIFLSNTNFYTKMFVMLCKTINEKNVHLRHLSATYIKTLLEVHGSKESVKAAIERAEALTLLDQFLRKGLVDAAPIIRDSCRTLYWAYLQLWEKRAERLCKSMDVATQRLIEKSKPKGLKSSATVLNSKSNSLSFIPPALSRASSSLSLSTKRSPSPSPSVSSRSSSSTTATTVSRTNVFKKPVLKSAHSAHALTTAKSIPSTSSEVRRNISVQKMSRLSHISNASAPSATVKHKIDMIPPSNTSRRTQSEFHQKSVLAAASLLHMLKSNDTQMKCKGIRLLSERLKSTTYNCSSFNTILPPNVPSKIDLLPTLMDILIKTDWDVEVYQTLMSWESLAGIFAHIMSVNYYCPTLVIANEDRVSNDMKRIYKKGLLRIKMFLKRNDAEIPERLLNLLKSVMSDGKLLDASVKRDIQLFPICKTHLQCGLLSWMDELLCEYLGIPEDEDAEILMEGSAWLHVTNEESNIAGQWFDENTHTESYITFVIKAVLETKPSDEMYPRLCHLAGHLKMANQRVFERETGALNKDQFECLENALGVLPVNHDFSIDKHGDNLKAISPLEDIEMMEDTTPSSGLTQQISTIEIKPQTIQQVPERQDVLLQESNIIPMQPITSPVKAPTRPAFSRFKQPIARRISIEPESHNSHKKRRKESTSNEESIRCVLGFINSKDKLLLPRLQEISDAIPTNLVQNIQFWSQNEHNGSVLLFSLLETIVWYFVNNDEFDQAAALDLINNLLNNQTELFNSTNVQQYSSILYKLSKALILVDAVSFENISHEAETAFKKLFTKILSPNTALSMLWDLTTDKDLRHPQTELVLHPFGTLLRYIGQVAPNASYDELEKSLQNGGGETLLKGFNDQTVSVRRSSVLAAIGIHAVLGDQYIQKYLSKIDENQLLIIKSRTRKRK